MSKREKWRVSPNQENRDEPSGRALSLLAVARTNSAALAALAAGVAIASKFALRIRGKHIFNPTNFWIVATMLATGGV